MEKRYVLACARYIELNPVRAELVKKPEAWPCSSAGPHMEGRDDLLIKTKSLCTLVQKSWRAEIAEARAKERKR